MRNDLSAMKKRMACCGRVWVLVMGCLGLSQGKAEELIGNSFSGDAPRFLNGLAVAGGKLREVAHRAMQAQYAMGARRKDEPAGVEVNRGQPLIVEVNNRAELDEAVQRLVAGMTVRLLPGEYGNGLRLSGIKGTAAEPVVIEGADELDLPQFSGGYGGIHVAGAEHLVLRRMRIRGASVNGLNVDDGGEPGGARHIRIEGVQVAEVGPTGNHDGIKLSGLQDFVVTGCKLNGWGGQAVDMVGCRDGVIEGCEFVGLPGFSQSTGVQMKGGSERIVVRRCRFEGPMERAVNLGGSTGQAFFRPLGANHEGRRLVVEDCLFVGGQTGVAFVGCEESTVRYNTFIWPERWALRILQENTKEGMVPCRNNVFERNLVVAGKVRLRAWINVGGGTEAGSFRFSENWWYGEDAERALGRELPAVEAGGVYGEDPSVEETGGWRPTRAEAKAFGVRRE